LKSGRPNDSISDSKLRHNNVIPSLVPPVPPAPEHAPKTVSNSRILQQINNIRQLRFALIFGCGTYQDRSISQLHNTANDCKDMYDKLRLSCNFRVAKPLVDTKCTRAKLMDRICKAIEMIQTLAEQLNYTQDTVLLIYFSGHGCLKNDKQYLLPHDAKLDQVLLTR